MNKGLYASHDMTRFMMSMVGVAAHVTAQQLKAMTMLAEMNPMIQYSRRQMANALDAHPTAVTFRNFGNMASGVPAMADMAARMPKALSVHFGATDQGGDKNQPLQGNDPTHTHLHFSMLNPHKNFEALAALIDLTSTEYPKPDYEIDRAVIEGKEHPVTIKKVVERDFVDLLHFDTGREDAPKVLLAAPMSGHYSTLIRTKVQSYLNAGMNVYVIDINNPRDIPAEKGEMGLGGLADRYVDFLEYLGPETHVDATCQATTPTLIATAWLAKNKPEAVPASLILVAAPIDPHFSPSEVTEYGKTLCVGDVEKNIFTEVPGWYEGAGRVVNPGFMQVYSFMAMNLGSHAHSYGKIYNHHVVGNGDSVKANKAFYEEYLAWSDMDGRYNKETIELIFHKNLLSQGEFVFRGEKMDLADIGRAGVAILTMEGEKDDISAPGQTVAAHDIIQPDQGYHYQIPGVGHYGSFHGSNSRRFALPQAFTMIHTIEKQRDRDHGTILGADGNPLPKTITLQPYHPDMKEEALAIATEAWNKKLSSKRAEKSCPSIEITLPDLSMAS